MPANPPLYSTFREPNQHAVRLLKFTFELYTVKGWEGIEVQLLRLCLVQSWSCFACHGMRHYIVHNCKLETVGLDFEVVRLLR